MRILIASIAVLFILTVSSTVWACDCVTGTPEESFRAADVVFRGALIRITPTSSGTAYTFRVSEVSKGPPASELTLEEGLSNCAATFSPDLVYRVYARRYEGKLSSSACAGNVIVRVIGLNRDLNSWPVKSSLLPKLFLIAAIGLAATGFWLWRRRRVT